MLRSRVIPVLLIKNNGLVKTTCFKNPVYVGDPINAVKIFNEKEVDELILLDITATNQKREPNYDKIREIVSEAFMPIGYGGGISRIDQIELLFKLGVEKVIFNTVAHTRPELISKAARVFGSQSIVVAIDVKKNFFGKHAIYTHSGKKQQKKCILSFLEEVQKAGAGELFLNSIDRDGTMQGYNLDLIQQVSKQTKIPLIACGGAGSIDDFTKAIQHGASAVAAGAMFVFQGVHRAVLISYPKYSELEEKLSKNKYN